LTKGEEKSPLFRGGDSQSFLEDVLSDEHLRKKKLTHASMFKRKKDQGKKKKFLKRDSVERSFFPLFRGGIVSGRNSMNVREKKQVSLKKASS